jgi:hypothetical protein
MLENATKETPSFEPIQELATSKEQLPALEGKSYAIEWIRRAFQVEVTRHTIEDRYVDLGRKEVLTAYRALSELKHSSDWMPVKLAKALSALRALTTLSTLPFELKRRPIGGLDANTSVFERIAQGSLLFQISSRSARTVPIMEDSLGDPLTSPGLVDAFARRINRAKFELRLTHLVFIEKEIGPVGALPMLSQIVSATNLPASIFREQHWELQVSVNPPGPDARIGIVYDMMVTGAGIENVADKIQRDFGASTIAAFVLRAYGNRIPEMRTRQGQAIKLDAIEWAEAEPSAIPTLLSSRAESETPNGSEVATVQEEGLKPSATTIPPGFYTRETLPPISEGAHRILERIRASQPKSRSLPEAASSAGLKVRDSGRPLGIRIKDSGVPLGIKGLKSS